MKNYLFVIFVDFCAILGAFAGPCRAQSIVRFEGQPICRTIEYEKEGRPIVLDADPGVPAGLITGPGDATTVFCLAFSPDGRTLAFGDGPTEATHTFGGGDIVNENGGLIRLVDLASGRIRQTLDPDKLHGREYRVEQLVFAADGRGLVSAGWVEDRSKSDSLRSIATWELAGGKRHPVITTTDLHQVLQLSISRGGLLCAYAIDNGAIRVGDTATRKVAITLGINSRPPAAQVPWSVLSFSPDHRTFAAADDEGEVEVWDLRTGRSLARFPRQKREGRSQAIHDLVFSADGHLLASGGAEFRDEDGKFQCTPELGFYDVQRGEVIARQQLPDREVVVGIRFSPRGPVLATAHPGGGVRLWDATRGVEHAAFEARDSWFPKLAFSPDGRILAVGGRFAITFWDMVTGKTRAEVDLRDFYGIQALEFSPDGRTLASAGLDVLLWDIRPILEPRRDEGHFGGVHAVVYAPDGRTLASASGDGSVKLWDVAGRKPRATLRGHEGEVTSVAMSPRGDRLASGGHDRTVRLWNPGDATSLATLGGHSAPITAVAFAPDGGRLASAAGDSGSSGEHSGEVKIWDVGTGRPMAAAIERGQPVRALAFSPDGATLAIGADGDDIVRLWGVAESGMRGTLRAEVAAEGPRNEGALCLAYAPDGQRLAAAYRDGTVRLWKTSPMDDGRPEILREGAHLVALAFSPDGERLAMVDDDGPVRLWSMTDRRELARLDRPSETDRFTSLAFARDGKSLAIGHRDPLISVWRPESNEPGR